MRICITLALVSVLPLRAGADKALPSPGMYQVSIIDGEGALNNLQAPAAHEPVIRVFDTKGLPLPGAFVEFDTPKAGPGATFKNGATHLATTTNSQGFAIAEGLKNNGVAGPFAILVHISSQGQTVAQMTVHQTNIQRRMAALSSGVQNPSKLPPTLDDASMSTSVVGIALGDQFMINGTPTPSNANLAPGSRVQTQTTPVTVYIHDHCEFLVGPHSSIVVQPHAISVASGAVRAKHFGDCKFGYGGLWVTSPAPDGDAVLALSPQNLEVGSVAGPLQVSNAVQLVSTVQPGTVTSFPFASSSTASGAVVGAPTSAKTAFALGVGTGAALVGLGLAVTAIAHSSSSTSP